MKRICNKNIFIFGYITFFSFFLSCGNHTKKTNSIIQSVNGELHSIDIEDTFKLKVPNGIPVPQIFNYINDNKYGFSYSYSNVESQTIIECDIANKKWETHTFNFEGPNGIKGFSSFYITDDKDILILPSVSNTVLVFDNNDKLVETYKYDENVMIGGNFKYHCYYKNGIIYFPGSQYYDYKEFGKAKLIKKLDFNKKAEENIVPVPVDFFKYHSDNSFDQSPEFVFPDDTTIVFIMRKSPNIYVYNINTKKTDYYHYPNENINYNESDIVKGHDNLDYINIKGYYHSILYDKINKYYYRFSQYNHIKNVYNFESRRVRIDVFDKNFNIIASDDFKNLFPSYAFIVKGKLYVATLNTKENYINYIVFFNTFNNKK